MSASPPASDDALLGEGLATKVFAIPELAEMILLNLPMKDLLLAQLICKDIKNLIDSSTPIQRALFFLPGEADSAHFESKHMSAPFNLLPRIILFAKQNGPHGQAGARRVDERTDSRFPSKGGVNVNPMLCRYCFVRDWCNDRGWYEFQIPKGVVVAICSAVGRKAERGESTPVVPSFARMYFTQPPIAISVDMVVSRDDGKGKTMGRAIIPRGAPIKALMEKISLVGKRSERIWMASLPTVGGDSDVTTNIRKHLYGNV
ncbi:hypothetical protein KC318_g9988 [Hortaea werneckii]|nr:hypothetical protein KC334_g1428 [Hortaea werneckii]KAI7000952.1 hypothetical protein KC355_g10090 [Hortaea werneckii]KAI7660584.1 hypothetical protein KC318_g9988 [Hortaea werneckii]